jgi:hypothetical protein
MRAQEFLAGVRDNEHCGLAPAALQTANPQGDLCDVQEAAGLFPPRKRCGPVCGSSIPAKRPIS